MWFKIKQSAQQALSLTWGDEVDYFIKLVAPLTAEVESLDWGSNCPDNVSALWFLDPGW